MNTTKLLICAISVGAALTAAKAGAQDLSVTLNSSLTATLNGYSPALGVNGTVNNGGLTMDYPSGVMNFAEFDAFCVQPTQSLAYDETVVYRVQHPIDLATSTQVASLVGGYLSSSQSAVDAAAVQWAIWEITTEKLLAPSLLDGNVRITTPEYQAVVDLADQYLANIDTFVPVKLAYLTNEERQNVVAWGVIIVPEPSSACLVALSALICVRRRR